jgi:hypothetical protein
MEEINVSLFPPAGAGIITTQDLQGNTRQQLAMAVDYLKVRDLVLDGNFIAFTTRAGDRIKSTLPYCVKVMQVQPEGHEA